MLVVPTDTDQQDPSTRSPWQNKDMVPILVTSRGAEGWGVQLLPAPVGSKQLIQTHHGGTSVSKALGEGGRMVQLWACPVLHVLTRDLGQTAWSKWESASGRNSFHNRITSIPLGSGCFATLLLQCCPTIFCTKATRAGTTWAPASATLPLLLQAADASFCSFLSTPQALRHREHLCGWDPAAGSTPAPRAWLSVG